MSLRVLIVPDKFKGTLSAANAARAIARGWQAARPDDKLVLLPMSDGGDGFGEVFAQLLGARARRVSTVDAAHRPLAARWWWEPRKRTAIIESANIIGLAQLPRGQFHPFQLDTFGLGKMLRDAAKQGARRILIGIGGSATNDGGFGLACALGWRFLRRNGTEIKTWTDLAELSNIVRPDTGRRFQHLQVAVDVHNPLLGLRGCTRVYGPQKGLLPAEFRAAEAALRRLAIVARLALGRNLTNVPGAGAAGGLGFGLMAFANAKPESGFELFARHARLRGHIRQADLVITGEGTLDHSTLMGKGVGEVAKRCRELGKPCFGIGGQVSDRHSLRHRFARLWALADFATPARATRQAARYLTITARAAAQTGGLGGRTFN